MFLIYFRFLFYFHFSKISMFLLPPSAVATHPATLLCRQWSSSSRSDISVAIVDLRYCHRRLQIRAAPPDLSGWTRGAEIRPSPAAPRSPNRFFHRNLPFSIMRESCRRDRGIGGFDRTAGRQGCLRRGRSRGARNQWGGSSTILQRNGRWSHLDEFVRVGQWRSGGVAAKAWGFDGEGGFN